MDLDRSTQTQYIQTLRTSLTKEWIHRIFWDSNPPSDSNQQSSRVDHPYSGQTLLQESYSKSRWGHDDRILKYCSQSQVRRSKSTRIRISNYSSTIAIKIRQILSIHNTTRQPRRPGSCLKRNVAVLIRIGVLFLCAARVERLRMIKTILITARPNRKNQSLKFSLAQAS